MKQPTAPAPTQELGAALYALPDLEGFLSLSARVPDQISLIVFTQKLQPGSYMEFHDPIGNRRHQIP